MFNWIKRHTQKSSATGDMQAAGDANIAQPPTDITGLRLLIMDDNRDLLDILQSMLRARGAIVDAAESGQDGLLAFTANPGEYSAILIDMEMPNMRGDEVVRRIRSHPDGAARSVPILIMSGYADQSFTTDGGVYHLQKPFAMAAVVPAIGRALCPPPARGRTE